MVAEINRVEQVFSFHRADSMLSKLNQRVGEGWVRVDPELFGLVEKGLRAANNGRSVRSVRGAYLPTLELQRRG